MQEKYWKYMVQIKAWIFYLDIYAEKSYRWDRLIKSFLAIISSTSIAAWTIWSKCAFLWGFIIALSQVINAVKEFLPFSKRLICIKSFLDELKILYISIEKDWYNIANGE